MSAPGGSVGGKLGAGAAVAVLILILMLSLGGPALASGEGPGKPEPQPEPQPEGPPDWTWSVWVHRDWKPGEATPPAKWLAGPIPRGDWHSKATLREVSRADALAGAIEARDSQLHPSGAALTGDVEEFRRDVARGREAKGYKWPRYTFAVWTYAWIESAHAYEWRVDDGTAEGPTLPPWVDPRNMPPIPGNATS